MEENKIENFLWDLRSYHGQKKECLEIKSMAGILVADTAITAVAAIDSSSIICNHPIISSSLLAFMATITTISIVSFIERKNKLKLCKEKLQAYDFTDYCAEDSMVYMPNDKLTNMLDSEITYTDRKGKSNIRNLKVLGSIYTFNAVLQLLVGHYYLAALWANSASMYIAGNGCPLIAAKDTKKLIKQVKENGRVL